MRRMVGRIGVVVVSLMVLMQGGISPAGAQAPDAALVAALQGSAKLKGSADILASFNNGEPESAVIVLLQPSAAAQALAARSKLTAQAPTEFAAPGAPVFYDLQNRDIRAQLRATVTETVAAAAARLGGSGMQVGRRFSYLFGFAARVTPEALQRLLDDPEVVTVEPDRVLQPHLAQGIPLMNATTPRASYTGAGMSIAICDTGIDTSHPRLGGTGNPATDPIFNAKVIGGYDTGDSDGDPRPGTGGEAHGTACAGIAAGNLGTVGDYIGGVAPDAKLYAVKISSGTGGSASESSMIAGWEWALTHQDDNPSNPIMIISTSFGGGAATSSCDADSPGMTAAAANAVTAGITIFASSGNDGYCDSIAWPGCISYVNAVGAVYDANIGGPLNWCVASTSCASSKYATGGCSTGYGATDSTTYADRVTVYSNSASFLTLFAPSNNAYTTDIVGTGGYNASGDYDTTFGGTSAACPYAAGAAAVLQSAAKSLTGSYLTPGQVKQYLVNNGDSVTDTKVAVTKPRVNLGRAVNALMTAPPALFPWPMFLSALTRSSGPVTTPAYWGADMNVCCTTSSATFYLTLAGVTKASALTSCAATATWAGWASAAAGAKTFMWEWQSSGCGAYMGSFNYTLAPGYYHRFRLGWNGTSFTMTVYTSSTATAAQVLSGAPGTPQAAGGAGAWQRAAEIVLNIPGAGAEKPKGILKPTN